MKYLKRVKNIFALLLLMCTVLTLAACDAERPKPSTSDTSATSGTTASTGTAATTTKPSEGEGCAHKYERVGLMRAFCKECGEEKKGYVPPSVKILCIGNSFSDDATQHLWSIFKAAGVKEIIIGNLYIGGCSLDTHYSNISADAAAYEYRKNTSGIWQNTPNTKISQALSDEAWDIVTLQQASGYSGIPDSYSRLEELAEYVKENTLSYCKLWWHMTWAYQQSSDHGDFAKYNGDQMTMYSAITSTVQSRVLPTERFEGVIPSGTAVQDIRTSYFGDTLTRDGYHMSLDYGRYLTALTFFGALGGDVSSIAWVPVSGMEADLDAIREAVNNALKQPFAVTQSKYTEIKGFEGVEEILRKHGKDIAAYTEVELEEKYHGYYNSHDGASTSNVVYGAGNSAQYCATKIFTREELPVGSIIIIENGYKYRPEGWKQLNVLNPYSRPDNVGTAYVEISEAWWGSYEYRAFNISKTGGQVLDESDMGKLHLLIPKS